jgi:hypothetical protein
MTTPTLRRGEERPQTGEVIMVSGKRASRIRLAAIAPRRGLTNGLIHLRFNSPFLFGDDNLGVS